MDIARVTFDALRLAEREGALPSLVLSPVIAETGQLLFISNLAIGGERGPTKPMHFFELFPGSQAAFKLQTAVRLNATFPFITPAVELPTVASLRAVDAGYFDNYGVNAASAYLLDERIADWIDTNTSGLVLIQIRAYPLSEAETEVAGESCRNDVMGGRASSPLGSLAIPLTALWAARGASTTLRDDLQIELIKRRFNRVPSTSEDFFQIVRFVNPARASLSWYLPAEELDCLRQQMETGANKAAFAALDRHWRSPHWTNAPSAPDRSPPSSAAAAPVEEAATSSMPVTRDQIVYAIVLIAIGVAGGLLRNFFAGWSDEKILILLVIGVVGAWTGSSMGVALGLPDEPVMRYLSAICGTALLLVVIRPDQQQ